MHEEISAGESGLPPEVPGCRHSTQHGADPALDGADDPLGPPVLLMSVRCSKLSLDPEGTKVGRESAREVLPPTVHPKSPNLCAKLKLPYRVDKREGVEDLVLGGKEVKLQSVSVVVEEDDEVELAMRSLNGEPATNIAVNKC